MTGLMSASAGDSDRVRLLLLHKGLIKLRVENGLGILRFGMRTPAEVSSRLSCDEYRERKGDSGRTLSPLTSCHDPNFCKLPACGKNQIRSVARRDL